MLEHLKLGAVSGVIAGIVMGLFSMLLHGTKICTLCIISIGGGIFSGQQLQDYNVHGLILAWLVHFAFSASIGMVLAMILNYFNNKYHTLIGAGLLTLVYIAHIGVIAPLRGVFPDNQSYFDLLLVLFYHILFGSMASYLIVKYQNKVVV